MYELSDIIGHQLPQNEMAIKLLELYKEKWDVCNDNILKSMEECAMPFLIAPTNEYYNSDKRIMIIGQETNRWGGEMYGKYEIQTPENLMNLNDIFVNIDSGYKSPFWNFINDLQKLISDIKIVVNNIVKIGKKHGRGCDDNINNLTLQHFNILSEEIKILKPDILIFLTGPYYDTRIKAAFGEMKVEPVVQSVFPSINERVFAKITFFNDELPTAYRCYHPGYLHRSKNTENYKKIIVNLIKNHFQ